MCGGRIGIMEKGGCGGSDLLVVIDSKIVVGSAKLGRYFLDY